MDKLRGTGSTFSTSGKPWLPWRYNPKIGKRHAKFYRAQAGMTKAEIEMANHDAIAEYEQAHGRALRSKAQSPRWQPCQT